jgi:prephenate dehydratase
VQPAILTTLGGPGTFAGQAAAELQKREPRYAGVIAYLPTVDAVWEALADGAVDRIVLGAVTQRTGYAAELVRRLSPCHEPPVHVEAEAIVPYRCQLLGRPGTRLDAVRRVVGHGSLAQCAPYLEANLPRAERVRHPGSSLEAAREVATGDGSTAVIGTVLTAQETGLMTLASDVDGGASAAWWVLTRDVEPEPEPDRIVVASRVAGTSDLGALIAGLAAHDLLLRGCATEPTGASLFEVDALLDLEGRVAFDHVRSVVEGAKSARVAGAFRARDDLH